MNIIITGGGGMIGQKLAQRLATDGRIGEEAIESLTLFDVSEATPPDGNVDTKIVVGDLRSQETVDQLISSKPNVIFHLAAVVSGEAEKDFDKGYEINLDGTRNLMEAIRRADYSPRFVFASSISVFGAPFPESIHDEFFCTPLTSYGTQKAICELLVSDYARRNILDGIAIRLPTICVRPGKPNLAASGFFSNIIREPLAGEEAILPVTDDVLHWHASPRAAVGFMLHAATMDLHQIGPRRALTMPGIAVTVGEQISALRSVAGEKVVARIRREPDTFVQEMVAGWPRRFSSERALSFGFTADPSFEEIIRIHLDDELGGNFAT